MEGVALIAGIAAGALVSFIPGVPLALVLAMLLVAGLPKLLGGAGAVCFIAGAAGCALYARRPAAVYHPAAGDALQASLDVSLRLTAQGRGADALRIMMLGTDLAWVPVIAFGLVILVFAAGGLDAARGLEQALSTLGVPIIGAWVVFTVHRAKRRFETALGFVLMGLFGYALLHAPLLTGNEHQMAIAMAAVFGVPITLPMLKKLSGVMPFQHAPTHVELNFTAGLTGSVLGCVCGFLAGLGAGSLVSMAESVAESDEDYLLMASAGETSNDLLALLLILLAGVGRSGEAVLLGRVSGQTTLVVGLLVFAAVAAGAYVGRKAVWRCEPTYAAVANRLNPRWVAVPVLALIILQAWLTGHLAAACAFIAAGTCLALWCRARELPLQVSFGALALPIAVQAVGGVPLLNGLLF